MNAKHNSPGPGSPVDQDHQSPGSGFPGLLKRPRDPIETPCSSLLSGFCQPTVDKMLGRLLTNKRFLARGALAGAAVSFQKRFSVIREQLT